MVTNSDLLHSALRAPDPRRAVFLSPAGPEVFHSVEHRHEIWKYDPFDVESLYGDAREVFFRLLGKATTPPGLPSGRIMLILGESGSGKTHLLRAFRNHVHGGGDGFVSYMQMTTATANDGRDVLGNLGDSLDQPYQRADLDHRIGAPPPVARHRLSVPRSVRDYAPPRRRTRRRGDSEARRRRGRRAPPEARIRRPRSRSHPDPAVSPARGRSHQGPRPQIPPLRGALARRSRRARRDRASAERR